MKISKQISVGLLFFLTSCVITPSVAYETKARLDGEVYGDWAFLANESIFDGRYYQSVSYGLLGGRLKLVTFVDSDSYIRLENGDSYICGINYSVNVTWIFEDFTGREEMKTLLRLSEDNKSLVISAEPLKSKIIRALNRYDIVAIRTEDDCGTVIDMIFEIKGETHLKILESG